MIDNHETINLLLEAAEETIEASIDSCSAITPFDIADKLPESQTNIDDNIIETTEKIANIVQDLRKLQELKQILLNKEDELKDIVTNYMGLHTTLTINNKPGISWKTVHVAASTFPPSKLNIRNFTGCFSKK